MRLLIYVVGKKHFYIISSTFKARKIDISVSDITGKVISKQSVVVIAGNNPVTMNVAAVGESAYTKTAVNT